MERAEHAERSPARFRVVRRKLLFLSDIHIGGTMPFCQPDRLDHLSVIASASDGAASSDLWKPMLADIQTFSVVEVQFA